MQSDLSSHPQLLALLHLAKESPEEDGPRLVLADWLDDQGDCAKAEFIRLKCQIAHEPPRDASEQPNATVVQAEQLLTRYGGAWLGSLWRFWMAPLRWHRGLLAVRLPRSIQGTTIAGVLPWIDTALFKITGRRCLHGAVALLAQAQVNHIHIDLRMPMAEATLLAELSLLPESPCLRSFSIDWPLRMLRHHTCRETDNVIRAEPNVDIDFLDRLLRECPLGRHLTHLGSSFAFSSEQHQRIQDLGIEPVHAPHSLWMHSLPATCFRHKKTEPG